MSRLFVFLSSTSELEQERRSLREKLPPRVYDLYLFEEDRARRMSPEEHCRRQIEQAHVFLGLLGPGYGSPFPGSKPERSIVEWEHDVAMGQSGLEVLSFVKDLGKGEVRDPR
jgi:hypothetical protein